MSKRETKDLIKQAGTWKGWRIEDRGNTVLIFPADRNHGPITVHKTPSDPRAWQNTKARLRRAGAPI